MRYQLDGSGYRASTTAKKVTTGCAAGGCKGYELTRDLDFNDEGNISKNYATVKGLTVGEISDNTVCKLVGKGNINASNKMIGDSTDSTLFE